LDPPNLATATVAACSIFCGKEIHPLGFSSQGELIGERAVSEGGPLIRLKRINNFLCSMLVFTPFALFFVTLHGIFMHFLELTY
jgi:hypothetical protein